LKNRRGFNYILLVKRIRFVLFFLAAGLLTAQPRLEVLSVKRIWDQPPHAAFGDIIRFQDRWFCVFREGKGHVARLGEEDNGKLRVITSVDGESWESAALITEQGIDLRDPHLSITAPGELMIVAGGSEYPGGVFRGRQPRVVFSTDGRRWSEPKRVLDRGHWLWRVTWHDGVAWGVSKVDPDSNNPSALGRALLVRSRDGVQWDSAAELDVPGGNESTIRFVSGGRMVILMRTQTPQDRMAFVGWSDAPYTEWRWTKQSVFVGGPNFVVLPDGAMIAGGRWLGAPNADGARMGLGPLTLDRYEPRLTLPSGGDTSYPGFVFHDDVLWVMYYSSHEHNTAIYLARLKVRR
jgi:hypothetical protein